MELAQGQDGRNFYRLYYSYTNIEDKKEDHEVLVALKDGSSGPFDYKHMGKNPDGPSGAEESYEVRISQEEGICGTFNVKVVWKLGDSEERYWTVIPCKLGVKKLVTVILSSILGKNGKLQLTSDMELHRAIAIACSKSYKRKYDRSKSVVDSKKSKQ